MPSSKAVNRTSPKRILWDNGWHRGMTVQLTRFIERRAGILIDAHPQHTVEVQRNRGGAQDEESAAFYTIEEAREWADCMRNNFGWRKVWINGIEY